MVVMEEEYEVVSTKRRRLKKITEESDGEKEKSTLKRSKPEPSINKEEDIAPSTKKRKLIEAKDDLLSIEKGGSHLIEI